MVRVVPGVVKYKSDANSARASVIVVSGGGIGPRKVAAVLVAVNCDRNCGPLALPDAFTSTTPMT